MIQQCGSTGRIDTFKRVLQKLEEDPHIQLMEQYSQHVYNNSFQHCHNVAVYSFYLTERWGWRIDIDEMTRGAMLHDFYLYDIEESGLSDYEHGISHPVLALQNARKYFSLSKKEENIILSHMWPLPFSSRPRSKEAVAVNLADKYCAFVEIYRGITQIEQIVNKCGFDLEGEKK